MSGSRSFRSPRSGEHPTLVITGVVLAIITVLAVAYLAGAFGDTAGTETLVFHGNAQ